MNESDFRARYEELQKPTTVSHDLKNATLTRIRAQTQQSPGEEAADFASLHYHPEKTTIPKRRTLKRWGFAAAACLCTLALIGGLSLFPFPKPSTTNTPGFALQAHASTTNTLLSSGSNGAIVFDRNTDLTGVDVKEIYLAEGFYTGCLFSVKGEGITRIQASVSKGVLYRDTFEEFNTAEEPERLKELSLWKPTRRGSGTYYSGYDRVASVSGEKRNADQDCRVRLSKKLGSTIDVPVEKDENGTPTETYFGLWTNDDYEGASSTDAIIDLFDGQTLTVTAQFENGQYATQVIELHAADIKAEQKENSSQLKLIPEIVDRNNLGEGEHYLHSLYGTVVTTNNEPFPKSLENANEFATTVAPAMTLSALPLTRKAQDEIAGTKIDLTISEQAIHGPIESVSISETYPGNKETKVNPNTFALSNITAQRTTQLPENIAFSDTDIGDDLAYHNQISQQVFGFQIDESGTLSPGFSYITITSDVTNTTDVPQEKLTMSQGDLAVIDDDENHFSRSALERVFWASTWSAAEGSVHKSITIAPHTTQQLTTIYLVPDIMADDPNLIWIVDNTPENLQAFKIDIPARQEKMP